jgi:hypothetical protein
MRRRRTWWCRDEYDAALWCEIYKVGGRGLLEFGRCGGGGIRCEDETDGVGGPAEASASEGCAVAFRVEKRRDTVYVGDVSAVRDAEF